VYIATKEVYYEKTNLRKLSLYFHEYYTKSYDHFNKTRHGLCNKHHSDFKKDDFCEYFKDNEKRIEARKRISLETLETTAKYIKEIAQILKEEKEK